MTAHQSPYREPDWRARRCQVLIEEDRQPSRRRDDRWTWRAWRFLRSLSLAQDEMRRERGRRRHPHLAAAVDWRMGDDFLRWELEARLLARESIASVAGRFALAAGAVEAYAALYFDVLGALDSTYYIIFQVIGFTPGRTCSEKDVDIWLKLYGYMAGPYVLDALIEYYRDPEPVPDTLSRLDASRLDRLKRHLAVRASILARCIRDDDVRLFTLQRLEERLEAERLSGDLGEGLPPVRPGQSMLEGLLQPGEICGGLARRAAV